MVQGKENHSINLLSDASVGGPEGTVNHLMDIHFPGSMAIVLGGGKEDICFGSFAGACRMIDCYIGQYPGGYIQLWKHQGRGPGWPKTIGFEEPTNKLHG